MIHYENSIREGRTWTLTATTTPQRLSGSNVGKTSVTAANGNNGTVIVNSDDGKQYTLAAGDSIVVDAPANSLLVKAGSGSQTFTYTID